MKEKGFYLFPGSTTHYSGVEKKVDAQISALSKVYDVDKVIIEKERTNVLKSISWRLPFGSWGAKYGEALEQIDYLSRESQVAFFYIRAQALDSRYMFFLNKLRDKYPEARILYEIPTYPYDLEYIHNKQMWPWFFKDRIYRNYLNRYVDRVVTMSVDDVIYGIPTIRTLNGILVDGIHPVFKTDCPPPNGKVINLLAVAQFQKSHGYERIIKGLYAYNKRQHEQKVLLHMIGNGEEKEYYESLVKEYQLQDSVIFYGEKKGEELVDFYAMADIGLSCFGFYKRKIKTSSALKVRECLAYGLPVVSGAYEDVFGDEENEFFLRFPNDDSIIEIDKIVDFYNGLADKYEFDELRKKIRKYAKDHVDIEVTMKPIIAYLKDH